MSRSTRFDIRCTPDERQAWHDAADAAGLTTAAWVRLMLSQFAAPRKSVGAVEDDLDGPSDEETL